MFENLLGQEAAVAALRADLERRELPPSLLFSGPPASGKLTAALELARVLSCESTGEVAAWNCPCPACARHRGLAHPDLLLLGPRSFPEEIPAALEMLGRSPGRAGAYFLVRAVRKLAKRFDTALYEGEESRLAKAAPLLREIEERLDAVAPERATAAGLAEGALDAAAAAVKAATKLEALVPDAPPVFQVRAAETWSRLAPRGRHKTIVIENADSMQDSARNALLKILEEPPRSLSFVLVSSRRSALIRTLLSRVRPYAFAARDDAANALVLERVFRAPGAGAAWAAAREAGAAHAGRGGAPSVEDFLAARRAFPPAEARVHARAFLAEALSRRSAALEASGGPALDPSLALLAAEGREAGEGRALRALLEATKDFGQRDDSLDGSFAAFLSALDEALGALLRDRGTGPAGLALVGSLAALARDAHSRRETFNLPAPLLAEGLLSAMGEP